MIHLINGWENCYGDGIFSREDSPKLNGILKTLRGKFILFINDHPKTREIFKGFETARVKTQYGLGTPETNLTELLISNF